MDKILEFINNKTNNKYKDLLFFDAVYNSKDDVLNVTFKKPENNLSESDVNEIRVICKLFVNNLAQTINVYFKTDNLSLQQFKDCVRNIISNHDNVGIDLNGISYDFDKTYVYVKIPYAENSIKSDDISYIKQDLEKTIYEQTGKLTRVNFAEIKNVETDVIALRKERIREDNKIYEEIKQSQIVNFLIKQDVYNTVSATSGLIAGCDIGTGNVVVVGKIKSVTERLRKGQNESEDNAEQSKYLTIELEHDGLTTKGVLFLKKGEQVPDLNNEDSVVVEGVVNEFKGLKNVRIKNIAKCEYEAPKQVWRNKPATYRYIKPEVYESFEQSNFFMMQEETKCEYLKNNTFVVYDLETTGIDASSNDIIDIGAFKVVNGKITEKFSTFVNPLREIPKEASKINHITNSLVENSPTIEQVLPDFYNFCYGSIIVGYNNIGFDDLFIKKEGKKYLYNFDNKRDDVMVLAKTYLKGIKNYKLGTVCNEMNVPLIDAHRATNDALATAKLFIKIAEKFM